MISYFHLDDIAENLTEHTVILCLQTLRDAFKELSPTQDSKVWTYYANLGNSVLLSLFMLLLFSFIYALAKFAVMHAYKHIYHVMVISSRVKFLLFIKFSL